jgi:hypothetical protein
MTLYHWPLCVLYVLEVTQGLVRLDLYGVLIFKFQNMLTLVLDAMLHEEKASYNNSA